MRVPPFRFAPLPLLAGRALCALIALVFAAAALSCAPMRPATRVRVISPPPPQEAPLPESGPPSAYQELPPPVLGNGEKESSPSSELPAAPSPGLRIPAPPTSNSIALVLPLEEPAFARAAGAVRDGFLDAANAAGKGNLCIVIPHARDGVVAAFETARAKGVRVAVGPLVRDDLRALALANADLPWTLALNQLDDGTQLPPAIYTFPLTVESDGRTLARRALANGFRLIDIVEGDSPLMKRLAASFATEWTKRGGAPPAVLRFDPAPDALTALRRTLSRDPPDAAVLAVTGDHAALVKPFIGNIVAYASGLVFEKPSPAVARDLDGVRVVEIPWLLTPDAPAFANVQRRDFDSDALARLYALGRDAFRIADAFTDAPPERFELDGATGHVSLGPGREFQREGRIGVYRDGVLTPLDSTP